MLKDRERAMGAKHMCAFENAFSMPAAESTTAPIINCSRSQRLNERNF